MWTKGPLLLLFTIGRMSTEVFEEPPAYSKMLVDKRDHMTPVLVSLCWLPIKSRIVFRILLLTYEVLRGPAPSYLEELIAS